MSCAEKKDNDLEYWSIGGSADLDYDPAALFNKNFNFDFKTISIPWTEHEKNGTYGEFMKWNGLGKVIEVYPLDFFNSKVFKKSVID